jgi:8-oxo-dGTP pyrophosphatase MutT (NUDIX family)
MEPFESTTNPYGGVVPSPEGLPDSPEAFRLRLQSSLGSWRAEGFKVVWLQLPVDRAALVPAAIETGFAFHHTGQDYLMLTYPLVKGAFVPPYASHYIGAGGVVLNGDNELLVVHERYSGAGSGRSYKLPGGAVHEGEHLAEGVVREVLEETGVRTRFEALACFRLQHGYRYGKSDIYFVCRLAPLTHRISRQKEEIEECLWMPLERFLSGEDVSSFNKSVVQAALQNKGLAATEIDGYRSPRRREVFMPGDGR